MKSIPLRTLHAVALFFILLFLTVLFLKHFSVSAPDWVFFYLNDFLCIPIVATLCLRAVWFVKRDYRQRLNLWTILSLVIVYSIYFEYHLPKSTSYVGDPWDIFCYFLGGILFFFLQKIENKDPVKPLRLKLTFPTGLGYERR